MSIGSDKFKFIYIRVPRTGSTTFVHYLDTTFGDHVKRVGQQHASALELMDFWGHHWKQYHTFGFIRNPWEWMVSMYNANISAGAGEQEPLPGRSGNGEMCRANLLFEDWLHERITTPMDWLSDEHGKLIVNEVRLFEDFVPNAKTQIGARPHSIYHDWYNPETMKYVAEKCNREIKIGKYEF